MPGKNTGTGFNLSLRKKINSTFSPQLTGLPERRRLFRIYLHTAIRRATAITQSGRPVPVQEYGLTAQNRIAPARFSRPGQG